MLKNARYCFFEKNKVELNIIENDLKRLFKSIR